MKKIKISVVVYFLIQLLSIFIILYIVYKFRISSFTMFIFLFAIETLLIITSIRYIKVQKNNIENQKKLAALKIEKTLLENQQESRLNSEHEISAIYSEIKEHINVLKKFDEKKDYNALSQYVLNQYKNIELNITQTEFCRNPSVNAALCYLSGIARQKNIHTDFAVSSIDNIQIPDLHLCILLLNLIENAIEAAQKTNHGFVYLRISARNNNSIIKIENSAVNFDQNMLTTKNNKRQHGLGIGIVKAILKEYGGNLSFSFNDNICTCIIII